MSEEGWVSLDSGLVHPPQVQRRAQPVSDELMEAVRQEFDGAITELMESIQPAQRNASALGVANYENEQSWGDGGWRTGAEDETLRLLSERLGSLHSNLYGGEYGVGYGTFNSQTVSDIVRQISSLIWVFPEYNPLIKQMVELRGLYVFGQGFEVRGESKKKERQAIQMLRQEREMRELEQQAMAAAGMVPPVVGSDEQKPGGVSKPGQSATGMANNAMMQRNGASGHASSTPTKHTQHLSLIHI